MYNRTDEDVAIAGRGVAPVGEAAPRQLAALLRIEDQNAAIIDLLTEIRDRMSVPTKLTTKPHRGT